MVSHPWYRGGSRMLLYAYGDLFGRVSVLYFDMDWHWCLPFLFYFFTAPRSLALRERGL